MFPRVLVVDDSAFMRSRIQRKLEGAGIEVVGEARTGAEAIDLYSRLRPDVVTMDLTMRDTDGLAASRSILRVDPQAKIVLFSVVDDEAIRAEAMEAGVRACVHKGNSDELVRRLLEVTSQEGDRAN